MSHMTRNDDVIDMAKMLRRVAAANSYPAANTFFEQNSFVLTKAEVEPEIQNFRILEF